MTTFHWHHLYPSSLPWDSDPVAGVPSPAPTSPDPYLAWPACYDAANDYIVLATGVESSRSFFSYQTWLFDGSSWTQSFDLDPLSGRQLATMAYLPGTGVILYGGFASGGFATRTYKWVHGTGWVQIVTSHNPGSRSWGQMAYHPGSGKIVLFGGGGVFSSVFLNQDAQTWTFNGTDWTHVSPTHSPPSMASDHSLVLRANGKLYLNGGTKTPDISAGGPYMSVANGGTSVRNTHAWSWNGTDWTDEGASSAPRTNDDFFEGAFHSDAGTAILRTTKINNANDELSQTDNITTVWEESGSDWATVSGMDTITGGVPTHVPFAWRDRITTWRGGTVAVVDGTGVHVLKSGTAEPQRTRIQLI